MTKYYSRSKQKFVDIEQMPDQYVRNAFVKMCKTEPTEDVIFAQQQSERADRSMNERNFLQEENQSLEVKAKHYKKLAEDNFVSSVGDLGEIEFLRHHNKVDIQTINKNIDTMSNMADKIQSLTKKNKELKKEFSVQMEYSKDIVKELNDKVNNTTYQPYDKQGRVRDYQVEYTKVAKDRDAYKKKANEMEMAKMNINRDLLDTKDKLKDTVSKRAYQIMFDECQKIAKDLDKANEENKQLKFQIEQVDRNQTVSKEAYDIAWQNMELWKKRYESQLPTPILGDVKMFSEIPNDPDGGSFVYLLRKYLNNVSYKIRVRGQYLDEQTKKTEGWKKYERGQPLEKSKCFRVYIDVKKDVD